jgi:hypothetical protein
MKTIEDYINIVAAQPSWSYRIEGGHQKPQVTVFDGVRHHSAIARKGETVAELFGRVLGLAETVV